MNANANTLPFIDHRNISFKQHVQARKINIKALAQYTEASVLNLSYSDIEDKDIPAIIEFLNAHPRISSLNLDGNNKLSSKGMVPLASVTTLSSLSLARTYKDCPKRVCIGGLEAKDMPAFANNTSLTSLNLFFHSIGDDGAITLAKNRHLTELNLLANNLTDRGGAALAEIQSLEKLSLGGDDVGSPTAIALAKNDALTYLFIGQTNMGDAGAIALAQSKHLSDLTLWYSNVGDAGAEALAKNTNIVHLDLSGTHVGINGAKALAVNTSITSLGLAGDFFGEPRSNDIGDAGALAFSQNYSLHQLNLSSQQITSAGAKELVKLPRVYDLKLAANRKMGDEGAVVLSAHQYGWQSLDLSACRLTDKGALAILKDAPNHIPLHNFTANSNFISDASAIALAHKNGLVDVELVANEIHDEGGLELANFAHMHSLRVEFNRMSDITAMAIYNNHMIDTVVAGGTNPYPPPTAAHLCNEKRPSSTNVNFCYRDANSAHCVNRDDLIYPRDTK